MANVNIVVSEHTSVPIWKRAFVRMIPWPSRK